MPSHVRIGIIGAGAVSDFHHVPGIRLDPRASLTAVCDPNADLLKQRQTEWEVTNVCTDYMQLASDPDVDAVIIATPNFTHRPIALECIRHGKHVMCEKPLGLNFAESAEMYRAARDAGVRHMTAFTYRFAPSMRYVKHLVTSGALGTPRHFRSQRFLDLPETSWGWRQIKSLAGAGDPHSCGGCDMEEGDYRRRFYYALWLIVFAIGMVMFALASKTKTDKPMPAEGFWGSRWPDIQQFYYPHDHRHGEWFNNYGNNCCGGQDCFPARKGTVKWTPEGYRILMPDGGYAMAPEENAPANPEEVTEDRATVCLVYYGYGEDGENTMAGTIYYNTGYRIRDKCLWSGRMRM